MRNRKFDCVGVWVCACVNMASDYVNIALIVRLSMVCRSYDYRLITGHEIMEKSPPKQPVPQFLAPFTPTYQRQLHTYNFDYGGLSACNCKSTLLRACIY